jgi:hypothetical protein
MNDNEFVIEAQFASAEHGSPEELATMADLGIRIGDRFLTRCEDGWARSVRDRIRVSCYPLATWIATSWWRLLNEPDSTDPVPRREWRMAHQMAAAGGGYLWPRVQLHSDGAFVEITTFDSMPSAAEPLRFLGGIRERVPVAIVETALSDFVSMVLARLHASAIVTSDLHEVWAEVSNERNAADLRLHRRHEAALGLDPGELEDASRQQLDRLRAELGHAAADEIAAGGSAAAKRLSSHDYLATIRRTLKSRGRLATFSPELRPAKGVLRTADPLRAGGELAIRTRRNMRVQAGPLATATLHEWLGLDRTMAKESIGSDWSLAVRSDAGTTLHCRKGHPQARRCELARFLADHLITPDAEAGLIQSEATTMRQKVQRAFAAELLAPIADLQAALAGDFTNQAMETVAAEFDVSTSIVTSQLVNHGLVPPLHRP